LRLFFDYKTFPDNYVSCRLWAVERDQWKYYYGSNYHPHQRAKLKQRVQREEFRILFDEKAVCDQLCRSMGINTPRTYGTICPGEDYREKITRWCRSSPTDSLFIKPVIGGGGKGALLAMCNGGGVVIRAPNATIPLSEFALSGESVVQEQVVQDQRMAVFSSNSVNTVRVATMLTQDGSFLLLHAIFRFGLGDSYVDNWSAGGIGVGIDCGTGRLKEYGTDNKGVRHVRHPVADIVFAGYAVPEWGRIVETAEQVQKAFSFYRLFGLDIALQASGRPILIEVNPCPDLGEGQPGPLLKNKEILRAFGQDDLLVNRHQMALYQETISK
jgi:hypothetical protein